jgi:membrane-bound metal-dependent hydrolase YbcI (DUF457 family)
MPNFKTHAVAGTVVGISVSLYEYYEIKKVDPNAQFDLSKLAFNSLAAIAGAIIPDKLEPAYHPNHRSVFHSFTAGGGAMFTPKMITDFLDTYPCVKYPAYAFILGYLSHLVLDASTPKSLPILA